MFGTSKLFCCAFLAACSGAPEEPSTPGAELTDTFVVVHPDGRIEQSTHAITAEQRQLETDQRTEATEAAEPTEAPEAAKEIEPSSQVLALTSNLTCASADLWIYDASRDNRLCISGANLPPRFESWLDLRLVSYGFGCLAIDSYGRCTQRARWAGHVARVLPGTNDGKFYAATYDTTPSATFSAWTPQSVDPARSILVVLVGAR